jgi:hypothetical protein
VLSLPPFPTSSISGANRAPTPVPGEPTGSPTPSLSLPIQHHQPTKLHAALHCAMCWLTSPAPSSYDAAMSDVTNKSDVTSKEEAFRAVKAQAFRRTSTEHPNGDPELLAQYPGGIVHCLMGAVGADWSALAVLDLLEEAKYACWERGAFLGHELAVLAEGEGTAKVRKYKFQIKAPAPDVPAKWLWVDGRRKPRVAVKWRLDGWATCPACGHEDDAGQMFGDIAASDPPPLGLFSGLVGRCSSCGMGVRVKLEVVPWEGS